MDTSNSLAQATRDACFIQAGLDAAFRARLGDTTDVEFNFLTPSTDAEGRLSHNQPVEIRCSSSSDVKDFRGTRIAVIDRAGSPAWRWAMQAEADLPQGGDDPAKFIPLARLLAGNAPVLRARQGDHEAIIAVDFHPRLDFPTSIAAGLRRSSPDTDERRAVHELAHHLGITVAESAADAATETAEHYSEGTTLHFSSALGAPQITAIEPGMKDTRIIEDAFYYGMEHQLYFQGNFPESTVHLNADEATAEIRYSGGKSEAMAVLIATISEEQFLWAWADPAVKDTAAAQAAANLYRFGIDHQVPALIRPALPLDYARARQVPQLALPILGMWTLVGTTLADGRVGLVLLDSEALHLPQPTSAATEATLAATPPREINEAQARSAYASFRGISL
ncbi:DUF6882 domain-containing protein [Corynebacterium accolens]|uniref:DUF6882 domain-containing protein n=1 Tax=Corynebacterium accolens TaxID=38284 RepID=UPI00254FEC7C|nr:DUF6882 domain-containing protein [Corynebacterium accolens]MDK8504109.1 hypothetical protein [Corynebacterium accolens]MDK8661356.1 hypothetical protein [Corynebacterium accolens]